MATPDTAHALSKGKTVSDAQLKTPLQATAVSTFTTPGNSESGLLLSLFDSAELQHNSEVVEASPVSPDDFAHKVVRIANRDHGLWVSRWQIDAVTVQSTAFTAEEVAKIIATQVANAGSGK